MFSFKVLRNTVIVLRGISGRDAFFSKGLDFMSGYRLLNPQLVDIMPVSGISGEESWATFMATFIRTEILERRRSAMIEDIFRTVEGWGDEGSVNMSHQLDEIVFALSMRISTCREFCEDPRALKMLMHIFERLEEGSTPSSLILSWIPTFTRVRRTIAGAQLYAMIDKVVRARKRSNVEEDDALQALILENYTMVQITRFVAMMLFASVTNTGNVLCWVLLYLEIHKEWKRRVITEIDAFIRSTGADLAETLDEGIAGTPLGVMDEQTPTLDLVISETLRIVLDGTFMRRNIGDDLVVDGVKIDHGAYLMFPTADLHFEPSLYPDPQEFNPLRFTPEEVEKRNKRGINYVGWGATRHICIGKRAAVAMMKMVIIILLSKLDTELCDGDGQRITKIPENKKDRLFKVCQAKGDILLHYRKRAGQSRA
ncbi:hypothetical protein PQX77_008137 [Marasmius sp. AFHP31]|nr:hypothetical protein PQX77_008137 [Marasmius sp. AFHP31]